MIIIIDTFHFFLNSLRVGVYFSFSDKIADQCGHNADSDPEYQRRRSTEAKVKHDHGYHKKKAGSYKNQWSRTWIFSAHEAYAEQGKDRYCGN